MLEFVKCIFLLPLLQSLQEVRDSLHRERCESFYEFLKFVTVVSLRRDVDIHIHVGDDRIEIDVLETLILSDVREIRSEIVERCECRLGHLDDEIDIELHIHIGGDFDGAREWDRDVRDIDE